MYLILNKGIIGYPDNTKEGVLLSKFDKTSDGVLIDVRMTKDNKLVLAENDLILKNYYISKMNYDDLKKINIGSGINNYYIPLLEEVLKFYDKDLLIINLHHNYDQNENLVNELSNLLNNYYTKKIIIVTDNDNLYDYLKLLTGYDVYNLNNHNNFVNVNVNTQNYNNEIIKNIDFNNEFDLDNFIDNKENFEDFFIVTNNPNLLKKYYL